MKHSCRWVLAPAKPGTPGTYCEKPVGYHMVEDGGEPGAAKVREYDPFCPTHMMKAGQ